MTDRSDKRAAQQLPRFWLGSLVAIALFFVLLVFGALHVQRTAELALAERHRELSEVGQRSVEVELETERILQESERRQRASGGAAGADHDEGPVVILLEGTAHSHAHAHGALWWDSAREKGEVLLAGLPPLSEPHQYELHVGDHAVAGGKFELPQGGSARFPISLPSPITPDAGAALHLLLRQYPGTGEPETRVVLSAP